MATPFVIDPKNRPNTFLCQFCPVQSVVIKRQRAAAGQVAIHERQPRRANDAVRHDAEDAPERRPIAAAVNIRRLGEIFGDLPEEAIHQPHSERDVERHINE